MAYRTNKNVRSDLADGIEQYWVGHDESHIGLQYLDLKDGKLVKGRYSIERTDVLVLQDFEYGCNIFVETDGRYSIQPWADKTLTVAERNRAVAAVNRAIRANKEYMAREEEFLTTKPWEQIYGMTPEEGVAHLRKLGW